MRGHIWTVTWKKVPLLTGGRRGAQPSAVGAAMSRGESSRRAAAGGHGRDRHTPPVLPAARTRRAALTGTRRPLRTQEGRSEGTRRPSFPG